MRTTVTLDDDAAALIEQERRRSGGSFKEVVNRLIRRGARQVEPMTTPPLPLLPPLALPGLALSVSSL